MGFTAVCSTLLLAFALPQGEPAPKLSASEHRSLREKLAKMIEARLEYDIATGRNRDKAQRNYEKTKEAWQKDWEKRCEDKGDLLKSIPDLREIFEGSFTYERKSGTGVIKREDLKDIKGHPGYSLMVPRSYKQDNPIRTVLLVPGWDEKSKGWQDSRSLWSSTWEGSAAEKDTLFHIAHLPEEMAHDLDPIPDYSKTREDEKEVQRIMLLLAGLGETKRTYYLDRRRLFLDCGKESSGFGLRLAAHFPDLFAGLILRWPVETKDLRLGSLSGLPVLLISSPATEAACQALQARLNGMAEDSCTVIQAADEYPFKASSVELEKWMGGVKRNLMRSKLVLEPNDDRFRSGGWAAIGRMDQIHTAAPDKRPRLEAAIDRAANRIDVKTVGIETFSLYLNDALVDLDKPFTVVVNGKAISEQRTRDFGSMLNLVIKKFDTEYLFPVTFDCMVPKEEKPAGDGTGTSGTGNGGSR